MAGIVYSVRFIAFTSQSNFQSQYTVPAGHVAVVRVADFQIRGGPGSGSVFLIAPSIALWYYQNFAANSFANFHYDGRQVFNPGEVFGAQVSGGPADAMVSGYLLTLP